MMSVRIRSARGDIYRLLVHEEDHDVVDRNAEIYGFLDNIAKDVLDGRYPTPIDVSFAGGRQFIITHTGEIIETS